jgi:N-acetyl-alpha-D-muramate 1-phosphate uridylyltransferase
MAEHHLFPTSPSPLHVKQAMILAAGRGMRFRPITDTTPKPLVEVGGKPLIDWQLEILEMHGMERVIVNTCYLGEQLKAHVSARHYRFEVIFSDEELALETGGGIKHALNHFNDNLFYSINSDVILYPPHTNLLSQLERAFTLRPTTKLALLLHPTVGTIGLKSAGDFFCNEHGAIWRKGGQLFAPYVFTGVQLINPSVFSSIDQSIFSMNVIYDQLLHNAPDTIAGIVGQGYMLHVGDVEGHSACEIFLQKIPAA